MQGIKLIVIVISFYKKLKWKCSNEQSFAGIFRL